MKLKFLNDYYFFKLCIHLLLISYSFSSFSANFTQVALVTSSSAYDKSTIESITTHLSNAGYNVTDRYLNQVISDFGYVNTDRVRADDLIQALLDDDIDILWFVRGGAGSINLLPYLFDKLEFLEKAKPKVLIGFSDVTSMHAFVNEHLKWPSIHGVVAGYNKEMFSKEQEAQINDLESIYDIYQVLTNGVYYKNVLALNDLAYNKELTGQLVGGNLTLVSSLLATKFQANFEHKILLLEDVGNSYRYLDRNLHQLLFLTNFNVDAIVFGSFYSLDASDEERLMYKTVLQNFAKKIKKPVYYYPFIGHGHYNHPLILGADLNILCGNDDEYCSFYQTADIFNN